MPFDNKDISDDEDFNDMKEEIFDFQKNLEDYLIDKSNSNMRILYLGEGINTKEVQRYLLADLALAVASIILIFIFMCFQTGSLWLSIFGILEIILAFPCAVLTYYFIFSVNCFLFSSFLLIFMCFFGF